MEGSEERVRREGGERRPHPARAGVRQARAGGETTPLSLRSLPRLRPAVRDFRTVAGLARVLCDVSRVITLFSGGAFGGDACAVGGAFGFEFVGIAGKVCTLISTLIGVVLEALVVGGLGYEIKPRLMSTQRLGFGLPAVGGVHLLEHLDPDSEPLGGGHEEKVLAPLGIAITARRGDYDAVLIDPASLTEISAMLVAPLQCCGAFWGDDGVRTNVIWGGGARQVTCVDSCCHVGECSRLD